MKKSELMKIITQRYLDFLKNLNVPIAEVFSGKAAPEKKQALRSLLDFYSAQCKEISSLNANYNARDLVFDLAAGLRAIESEQMKKGLFDEKSTKPIQTAKKATQLIFTYIQQKCIEENDEHELTVNLREYRTVDKKSVQQGIDYNLDQIPEAVITKDGTVYPVPDYHDTLIRMLISNNIDVSGAIRINAMDEQLLNISSLDQFSFIDGDLSKEKTIMLTDEQAMSLYQFFEMAKICSPELTCSFEDVLLASENLGWQKHGGTKSDIAYYNNKYMKINLETISTVVEEVHDPKVCSHRDHNLLVRLYEELKANNNIRRGEILANKNDGVTPSP